MEYKYYLPGFDNAENEYTTNCNSLIIIGANGSGKTRLGVWMEKRDPDHTYRIGAQRSLSFEDFIDLKSYEQAENFMLYGYVRKRQNHDFRWKSNMNTDNYASYQLDDYNDVLSALIAKKNQEQEQYINECIEHESKNESKGPVPEVVTQVLQQIWTEIFPQRDISFDDAKVTALFSKDETVSSYKGINMSDGEREALYLIAQVLCLPKEETIIVDEPEIHLHNSILNRMWTLLEQRREDCFFVYITHDVQFAANHKLSEKIWVKSFDGKYWELFPIDDSELPEELFLSILGSRKPVLFVEGTADSYDTKLYSLIFDNYYIVSCGSCSKVIERTKAMKETPQLHHLKCFGIIDRDYRSDYEIDKLRESDIYTLDVAEVENLFLTEDLLKIVNRNMGYADDYSRVEEAKEYIINDRFKNQIRQQICNAIIAEIKYELSEIDVSGSDDQEIEKKLKEAFDNINFNDIKNKKETIYFNTLHSKDYTEVLKIFNCKGLIKSFGHFWGLKDNDYPEYIIRQLAGSNSKDFRDAIIKFLPAEICNV